MTATEAITFDSETTATVRLRLADYGRAAGLRDSDALRFSETCLAEALDRLADAAVTADTAAQLLRTALRIASECCVADSGAHRAVDRAEAAAVTRVRFSHRGLRSLPPAVPPECSQPMPPQPLGSAKGARVPRAIQLTSPAALTSAAPTSNT